ncbi:MAG: methionyl-tRNA formyltransferase [Candidatus Nanogingivalis sp.]
MSTNSPNNRPIVFFGTEEFSAISLQALIDAGFEISAIITKPDSRKGRGQKLQAPTVKKIGEKFNIPVLQPSKMSEIVDFVENLPVRPIGVLVSFGRIIPQNIIELFDGGIVNVHPSLLPKYRGPSPIESTIFNGDKKTGVSIMSLSKEMDAGDVYIQEEFPLKGNETSSELYNTCGKIGAEMLINHLPAIMSAKMTANPQNESEATYCQLLKKSDAILNPETQTAEQAERQIRAFEIFPKSKIQIGENLLIVNSAKVVNENSNNSPLTIKFSDGKFLQIEKITAPSGKQMPAESYINGYLK